MDVTPGNHLIRDSFSSVKSCAPLQELPFGEVRMLGELCYTSQNIVPEKLTIDFQIFTSSSFFFFDKAWNCMQGNGIACTCSYSLLPFDLHEPSRDIRFRPTGEQQIYKIRSFHVEVFASTNFSNKELLRMNMLMPFGNNVFYPPRVCLKPEHPVGQCLRNFPEFGTHYTYTDLSFPAVSSSGNYNHKCQRYRMVFMLLADVGEEQMIPIATRESATLKVMGKNNQGTHLPFCSLCWYYLNQ